MRTWVKATIGGAVLIAVALAALAATGAYFVFRHMDTRTGSEADAARAIDAARARVGTRPPLIEIADPRRGDIRINRAGEPAAAQVTTIHILSWKRDTGELMRTQAPLWLLRFSTLNIASHLGLAPASFRLTVADIQHYGPGVVADYVAPDARVLVWVD